MKLSLDFVWDGARLAGTVAVAHWSMKKARKALDEQKQPSSSIASGVLVGVETSYILYEVGGSVMNALNLK